MMKFLKTFTVLAAIALGLLWYWSPFWSIYSMKLAIDRHDVEAFNAHVDYPKVRDSLRMQILADSGHADASGATGASGDVSAQQDGFKAKLKKTVANGVVNALIRPETVMMAMQGGKLKPDFVTWKFSTKQPQESSKAVDWTYERPGLDKLIIWVIRPGENSAKNLGVVFERRGFVSWKLTDISLQRPAH